MILTPARSRSLALGLFVCVVLGSVALVAWPVYATLQDQALAIETEGQRLGVYKSLAESRPALEAELARLQSRSQAINLYVQGETRPLASANMQKLVQTLIDRNGAEAVSSLALAPREAGEQGLVGIKVHLRADLKAAVSILYTLEAGKPMLFVRNLVISARPVRGAKPGDPPEVQLDMQFDLEGYIREDSNAIPSAG